MDEHIEELLPFYALDSLTNEERRLVESYLEGHPEARQKVEEMSRAAASLPHAVAPVEPPAHVRQNLMKRIASDERARSSEQNQPSLPGVRRPNNIFQALSLGAALVAVVWAVVLNIQLVQLRAQVSSLRNAILTQADSLEQINAKLPQVPTSAVITISLHGTTARPQAQGQLITDPNTSSAVLVVTGLAPPNAGETYQVWLIEADTMVSSGILTVDVNGSGVLIVNSSAAIREYTALGISIEPEGGSPQPTGEIVVLSDL